MGEDFWWEGVWNRRVLSLDWKKVGVMDGESGNEGARVIR